MKLRSTFSFRGISSIEDISQSTPEDIAKIEAIDEETARMN